MHQGKQGVLTKRPPLLPQLLCGRFAPATGPGTPATAAALDTTVTPLRLRRGAEDGHAPSARQTWLGPAVRGEGIREITIDLGGCAGIV